MLPPTPPARRVRHPCRTPPISVPIQPPVWNNGGGAVSFAGAIRKMRRLSNSVEPAVELTKRYAYASSDC